MTSKTAVIEEVARWIGHATFSANNQPSHPKRDTAAARPNKKSGTKTKSEACGTAARAPRWTYHQKVWQRVQVHSVRVQVEQVGKHSASAVQRGAHQHLASTLLNDFINVGAQIGKGHVQKI